MLEDSPSNDCLSPRGSCGGPGPSRVTLHFAGSQCLGLTWTQKSGSLSSCVCDLSCDHVTKALPSSFPPALKYSANIHKCCVPGRGRKGQPVLRVSLVQQQSKRRENCDKGELQGAPQASQPRGGWGVVGTCRSRTGQCQGGGAGVSEFSPSFICPEPGRDGLHSCHRATDISCPAPCPPLRLSQCSDGPGEPAANPSCLPSTIRQTCAQTRDAEPNTVSETQELNALVEHLLQTLSMQCSLRASRAGVTRGVSCQFYSR